VEPGSADATLETPTIESPIGDFEPETSVADQTAEIELDDLGLDLSELDAAANMVDVGEDDDEVEDSPLAAETLQVEVDNLDSLGVSLDETQQHQVPDDLLEIGELLDEAEDSDPTGEMPHIGDTEEQPTLDSTAEQPAPFTAADEDDALIEPGELAGDIDFDVGENLPDGDATTHVVPTAGGNGATQTELGTKLDLARAYIDMGDPDGAKSILNEVLEEAPADQRQEAQKLLDDLDS
jgi:pilus assembly protein FimV